MQKLCDDDFSHRMASEKFPDSGANCSAKLSVLHRCNHRFFFPFTIHTDFFYEFFEQSLIERALCKMKGFFFVVVFLVVFNGELLPGFVAYDDCGGSSEGKIFCFIMKCIPPFPLEN
uniref:(northern house mosquito) hypothetical protein n=1 Tax=Culex pipiens TaxID=7175 RepID=A0A8D8B133_CULPI